MPGTLLPETRGPTLRNFPHFLAALSTTFCPMPPSPSSPGYKLQEINQNQKHGSLICVCGGGKKWKWAQSLELIKNGKNILDSSLLIFHCPIMRAALMCARIVVAECFEARGRSLRIITASGGPSSAHGGRRGVAIKASAQDLHQLPGHRQHHDHNQLASLISSALPLSPLLLSTKTITTVIDTNSKTIARLIYREDPVWQQMTMITMSTMLDCVGSLVWGLLPLSLIHSDTLLYQ